jgi:hypothetical protein
MKTRSLFVRILTAVSALSLLAAPSAMAIQATDDVTVTLLQPLALDLTTAAFHFGNIAASPTALCTYVLTADDTVSDNTGDASCIGNYFDAATKGVWTITGADKTINIGTTVGLFDDGAVVLTSLLINGQETLNTTAGGYQISGGTIAVDVTGTITVDTNATSGSTKTATITATVLYD